jgi:hypothetical protein
VVSKLAAGRSKDHDFAKALLREGLVDATGLLERIDMLPDTSTAQKGRLRDWVMSEGS